MCFSSYRMSMTNVSPVHSLLSCCYILIAFIYFKWADLRYRTGYNTNTDLNFINSYKVIISFNHCPLCLLRRSESQDNSLQSTCQLLLLFTCEKVTPLRWFQFLLMAFQVTVFKSPVTSLIVNVSIAVLTCPFILLNVNSVGAVSEVATIPFITLT